MLTIVHIRKSDVALHNVKPGDVLHDVFILMNGRDYLTSCRVVRPSSFDEWLEAYPDMRQREDYARARTADSDFFAVSVD